MREVYAFICFGREEGGAGPGRGGAGRGEAGSGVPRMTANDPGDELRVLALVSLGGNSELGCVCTRYLAQITR